VDERALSYADWTKRLCEHFFKSERAGQAVTFFVDDELLGLLEGSGDPAVGAASLISAVKTRLVPDSWGRRFNRIDEECTRWKVTGGFGCPPSLPLLAVAVLAATRMAREEGIGSNNYWRRFRDLLGLDDRRELRGINEVLPGLWEQLTWWLDERHQGTLGRSTVQEDAWWTIIGYALSQALFRESDRQHLTELFRRIGLVPGEQVDGRELLQYFKAWAPGSPMSPGAKHMASDSRYDDRLRSILADEAGRWDGVLRDARGRKVGSLVITYEPFPRPTYRVAAERPEGFPDEGVFANSGFSVTLHASGEDWYEESWALEPAWLREGLRLEGSDFLLVLRPNEVVPLARNRDLGCWSSVARVEPSEKHAVLAEGRYANEVARFLESHALGGWTRVTALAAAPPGWTLFTGVVLESAPRDEATGPVSVLAPSIRERPTLRGGLLLDHAVSLYLEGGEPDLWLPTLLDDQAVVTVNGDVLEARPGQRLPLRSLALEPGTHEVRVGAAAPLRFTTVDALRTSDAPGTGSVSHRLCRIASGYEARSAEATSAPEPPVAPDVAVAGARLLGAAGELPPARPTLVLPRNADAYLLLGAVPGQALEVSKPGRPAWMDTVGKAEGPFTRSGLFPVGFEVHPRFEVVWVIASRRSRQTATLRTPLTPDSGTLPAETAALAAWRTAFRADVHVPEEARELWQAYSAVAADIAEPDVAAP
jgi:hypothetical protein